jgi:choline dehydrogenase
VVEWRGDAGNSGGGGRVAFDVIIVGGGSAGCVLAARLTEDPGRSVLLLEAGPDYPLLENLPPEIADGTEPALTHDWGFASQPDESGRSIQLFRGRLMGGCSSTNACMALRGSPADYDGWPAAGGAGWSFDDVLPFFRAAETDRDFGDRPWHGSGGPLPIRRYPVSELDPLQAASLDAARKLGHGVVEDHNEPWIVGAGPVPVNCVDGVRMSTSLTYLAAARGRANLSIRADTLVDRVAFSGTRAIGVKVTGPDGSDELIEAGTVVVAAGAYASPAILLRSGVGSAPELAALGIPSVVHAPGVGANLIEHAWLSVDVPGRPGPKPPSIIQTVITFHSAEADTAGAPDLQMLPCSEFEVPLTASPTGSLFFVAASVIKPLSRGTVRLRSPDPAEPPAIDPAFLRHPHDMTRALEAVRATRSMLRTPPLSAFVSGEELKPAPGVADDDDEALIRAVRATVDTYFHPVGTCRMGVDDTAVVDPGGRVHGIDGLRVCDASVMPDIPSANTNVPTIMVAERMAALMREEL